MPSPVISTAKKTPDMAEMSDQELLDTLYPDQSEENSVTLEGDSAPAYVVALQEVFESDPNAKPKLIELLERGNPSGTKSVLAFLRDGLDTIVYLNSHKEGITPSIMEDIASHTPMAETFVRRWSLGSVRGETSVGDKLPVDRIDLLVRQWHKTLRAKASNEQGSERDDTSYYRALTALCLTNQWLIQDDPSEEEVSEAGRFVEWASKQEYLGNIVDVGEARDIRDVEHIKSLLELNSEGGASALSSGNL